MASSGEWALKSGAWRPDAAPQAGFRLQATALGHVPAEALSPQDLRAMFHAGATGPLYPPEFRFSPATGEPLERPAPALPWIPPFGAAAVTAGAPARARGLWRCESALPLAALRRRGEHDDPDARLAPPPPGRHEFFSLRAATAANVLLALDLEQGVPFVYLPHSRRWEALAHPKGGLLAPAGVAGAAWRCEVAEGLAGCRLLLPTEAGLARLRPDAPALCFDLEYAAGAPALGGPIQLGQRLWLPLRRADGAVQLAGIDAQADPELLDVAGIQGMVAQAMQAPVATAQWAVWPCAAGQLRLRRQPDERCEADFLHWPPALTPRFDFGCPYQAGEGGLWQLCFDEAQGRYAYLRLADEGFECMPTTAPRSCSGRATFRSAQRDRAAPWDEPEHVDDSRGTQVILPLLEVGEEAAVLGVRMAAPRGLAGVFDAAQRQPAELVLDDRHGDVHAFQRLPPLTEPWRLRLFVHDAHLWAYHPELKGLQGWRLAS